MSTEDKSTNPIETGVFLTGSTKTANEDDKKTEGNLEAAVVDTAAGLLGNLSGEEKTNETPENENKGQLEEEAQISDKANALLGDSNQNEQEDKGVLENQTENMAGALLGTNVDEETNTNAQTEETDDYNPVTGVSNTQTSITPDGEVGILNFEEYYADDKVPIFTEEATLVAMERLQIEPKEIMKPQPSDYKEFPDFPDVRKKVESILLARRDNLIAQIIEERDRYLRIDKPRLDAQNSPTAQAAQQNDKIDEEAARKEAIGRIEKMQRREIEQMIMAELIRTQTLQDEEERQQKREERQRQQALEVKQRQLEEKEKRHRKEEALIQRVAQKEQQLIELKKKQEEDIEKNQRLIAEMKAKRIKEMQEADYIRQQKAIKQREALVKQEEEEKKKIIERQKQQVAHEMMIKQRRVEQLNKIKERNKQVMIEQKKRYAAYQQRSVTVIEERRKTMELKEIKAQDRYENVIKQRDIMTQKRRARSEIQVKNNITARNRIEKEKEERIKKLVCKETHDQERRDAIMAQKMERFKHEREQELEKQNHIKAQNEAKAQKQRELEDKMLKKDELAEKRIEEVEKSKKEELMKKVAIQKLHDRLRNEAAERKEKQQNYKIQKKGEINQEREKNAIQQQIVKQEIADRTREASQQLSFKKEKAIFEFREMVKRQGQLDLNELAKKYDIDVEVLKEKVAESRRGKRTVYSPSNSPNKDAQFSSSAPVSSTLNDANDDEVVESNNNEENQENEGEKEAENNDNNEGTNEKEDGNNENEAGKEGNFERPAEYAELPRTDALNALLDN